MASFQRQNVGFDQMNFAEIQPPVSLPSYGFDFPSKRFCEVTATYL